MMFIRDFLSHHKVLLILSIAIATIDGFFIYNNVRLSRQSFYDTLREEASHIEATFTVATEQLLQNLQLIATYVANDALSRELFLQGRAYVIAEGGGPGGERSAIIRDQLYQHVSGAWLRIQEEFQARQLHFHMGPGDVSFLRVHRPEKFGDDLSQVRHTITTAIDEVRPTSGFETGRIYAGLRGVVPIIVNNGDNSPPRAVGAIEAGSSFVSLLDIMANEYGAKGAVLLNDQHVQATMWPEMRSNEDFIHFDGGCECWIDSTNSDNPDLFINAINDAMARPGEDSFGIVYLGNNIYSFTQFPIFDFHSVEAGSLDPVGAVILWKDAGEIYAAYRNSIQFNIIFGILAFLTIECLIILAFRLARQRLESVIDEKTVALREINADLDGFARTISHDLKSPLNLVTGYIGIARASGAIPTEQDGFLEKAEEGAQRVASMIDSVGSFARHSRILDEFSDIPLSEAAEEAREIVLNQSSVSDATINIDPSLPVVRGSRDHLVRVFQNIMQNAIKYSDSKRSPCITVRRDTIHGQKRIMITDNGIGISEEGQSRIFDLFSQEKTLDAGGEGIGLASVRRILQKHDAKIKVSSQLGQGSCFTIDFR